MRFIYFLKNQKGQMLVEILVAIVIAGVVIGGVAGVIGTSLISSKKTKQVTVATGLAQQYLDAIKTVAQSSWIDLYCPPSGTCPGDKGTTSTYSVLFADNSWSFASSSLLESIDGLNFTHYFYVENVYRDEGGDIVTSGGEEDPSTQKVTVYITWSGGGSEFSLSEYLIRSGSAYFIDRGWTEGNLNDGPYTKSAGTYSTSSGDINIESGVLEVE